MATDTVVTSSNDVLLLDGNHKDRQHYIKLPNLEEKCIRKVTKEDLTVSVPVTPERLLKS
jgi:hypothetical protein